jgi:hypothetical protein
MERRAVDEDVLMRWVGQRIVQDNVATEDLEWLAGVATAASIDDALSVLYRWRSRYVAQEDVVDGFLLHLGLCYLRLERTDEAVQSLLRQSGDLADNLGRTDPPCETFYALHRSIQEEGITPLAEAELSNLFEPRAAEVRRLIRAYLGEDILRLVDARRAG